MWYLIFLFVLFLSTIINVYPFFISVECKLNVLRLKGLFVIKFFGFVKLQYKFRIKNGYIYIYHKNKEKKEKLTNKNQNVAFVTNLIKQLYFRNQLVNLNFSSNFGYVLNSGITAVGTGWIDVVSKCFFAKIKNNKKSAHIFVNVEPKYNEDICNIKLTSNFKISFFDFQYAFMVAKFYVWRDYEKGKYTSK